MKKISVIFLFILLSNQLFAQVSETKADTPKSTIAKDSFKNSKNEGIRSDSIKSLKKAAKISAKKTPGVPADSLLKNSGIIATISPNPGENHARDTAFINLFHFSGPGNQKTISTVAGEQRIYKNTDHLFYILAGLVLLLALLRINFPKYFQNIFSLSFQVKFRQTQTRDLLLQNRLPAFLLNVYFFLSTGLFITLLAQYFNWVTIDFWLLFLFVTLILAGIYLTKYLFINFSGWVFKAEQPAASYNFIVFLINKVLGIILIPFTVLFAFADDEIKKIVLTVTGCIVFSLLAFRYVVSLLTVKRNLNISAFHFFLYLCAVEIMPMLVIYKVLFLETMAEK